MNWVKIIKLALPASMRLGRGLREVVKTVTLRPVADAEEAERWKGAVVDAMKYIGQRAAMLELLRREFGEGIAFGPYEPSQIVYFSPTAGATEAEGGRYPGVARGDAVWMTPMSAVDLGADFTVTVPRGVDGTQVEAMLRRYIFMGVNFKIIQQ